MVWRQMQARRNNPPGRERALADGKDALAWIESRGADLTKLSDRIWELAEVGLQETQSAKAQEEFLRGEGFAVESGVAGMPTAFVASWGGGRAGIGFLGEYDALPGISQKAGPVKDPLKQGAPGHEIGR